jgi:hypothetical protein
MPRFMRPLFTHKGRNMLLEIESVRMAENGTERLAPWQEMPEAIGMGKSDEGDLDDVDDDDFDDEFDDDFEDDFDDEFDEDLDEDLDDDEGDEDDAFPKSADDDEDEDADDEE